MLTRVADADDEVVDFAFMKHPQAAPKDVPPPPPMVVTTIIEPTPAPAAATLAPGPRSRKVEIGTLGLDGPLFLDVDKLLETRMLIQASSGAGKSYLIRKILEETYDHVTQIVIDPEGEFGTLTEKFGYDFARPQAGTLAGSELAVSALRSGRSLIVDLYELERDDRALFVQRLIEGLMSCPKEVWRPCLIVVDEAHMFAPDKVTKLASAKPLIDLASRGRKREFSCVFATQRLSKLHKDIAAECLNKMIGRTSLERDLRRAGDELGMRGNRINQLRTLKTGSFFAFGPALIARPEIAVIGPVQTTHSARATPDANLDLDPDEEEDEAPPASTKPAPVVAKKSARKCSWCGTEGHDTRNCDERNQGEKHPNVAATSTNGAQQPLQTARTPDLEADLRNLENLLAVAAGMIATIRGKL